MSVWYGDPPVAGCLVPLRSTRAPHVLAFSSVFGENASLIGIGVRESGVWGCRIQAATSGVTRSIMSVGCGWVESSWGSMGSL